MKKILVLLITSVVISCSDAQKTEFTRESLEATLETTNGNQISFESSLKKHKGKILLIEIWATWCGDCVNAMPKIHELQDQNPDIDYLFIAMDKSIDKWKKGITKYKLKGEHVIATDQMKGVFAKSIDLDWIPRYIIVDQTGKIVIYKAIETDFDLINTTLKELKNKQTLNNKL